MGWVIVVGSVNVDFTVHVARLPAPGQTVTGGTFSRSGGGKGANQAVAAARAGARVSFVGAVGDDELGRSALDELAAEGIDVSVAIRVAGAATGMAAIVVDADGENQIAVASGANAELDGDAVRTALARLEALGGGSGGGGDPGTRGEAGDAEAGGEGVLLTGFEIGDDAVLAAVSWAAERGLRIVLNPAPSRPLLPGIAATRPILTPNASEAAALGGQRDDADAGHAAHAAHAAHLLPALTGAPVVVTLGEDGALLLDDGGSTVIPALPVDVVDATGAGDALNGILAAELASGSSVEAAARRGVAGASLSTMKTGARAGLPTATEIDLALESDADSLRTANEG